MGCCSASIRVLYVQHMHMCEVTTGVCVVNPALNMLEGGILTPLTQLAGVITAHPLTHVCLLRPPPAATNHQRHHQTACPYRRLEGSRLAQDFAVRLIKIALKRNQFYLCAEILRFLIPPQEGSMVQWGPAGPAPTSTAAAGAAGTAEQVGVIPPGDKAGGAAGAGGTSQHAAVMEKQPSGGSSTAQGSWFGWLWGGGGGGSGKQQLAVQGADKQQAEPEAAGGSAAAEMQGRIVAVMQPLISQSSSVAAAAAAAAMGMPFGTDACAIVADRAWKLLDQVRWQQQLCRAELVYSVAAYLFTTKGSLQGCCDHALTGCGRQAEHTMPDKIVCYDG